MNPLPPENGTVVLGLLPGADHEHPPSGAEPIAAHNQISQQSHSTQRHDAFAVLIGASGVGAVIVTSQLIDGIPLVTKVAVVVSGFCALLLIAAAAIQHRTQTKSKT